MYGQEQTHRTRYIHTYTYTHSTDTQHKCIQTNQKNTGEYKHQKKITQKQKNQNTQRQTHAQTQICMY